MNHFYSYNQLLQYTLSTTAVVGFPFNVIQHVIDINHFADSNKTKPKQQYKKLHKLTLMKSEPSSEAINTTWLENGSH